MSQTETPTSTLTPRQAKRELACVVIAIFLGSALALYVSTRNWWVVQTVRPAPFPVREETITGRDFVPWAAAMAFVGMAGAVALAATKKLGRVLVGVTVLIGGLVMLAGGIVGVGGQDDTTDVRLLWPAALLLAGVVVSGAAAFALWRHARWGRAVGMGARFENSAASTSSMEDDPAHLWDALDRDDDPTSR